ncbi:MAG: PAS domain S-box protein [Rhodocyclaceae bacterium]|nr:PAS domain S-box protein [Rhodocyclaceae bacterium]
MPPAPAQTPLRPPTAEALLAAFPDAALLLDRTGRVLTANAGAHGLLGATACRVETSVLAPPWHWQWPDSSPLAAESHPLAAACRSAHGLDETFRLGAGPAPGLAIRCRCRPLADGQQGMLLLLDPVSEVDKQTSREVCETLIDRLPVPLWYAADGSPRRKINQAWREVCGVDERATWLDTVNPADVAGLDQAYEVMKRGGRSEPVQFRLRDRAGETRWFIEHVARHPGTDACPAGFVGLAVDIGLLRQHDDAIRTLSRALEQTDARIVITDPHGDIEYVNAACCRAYGYTREELIGRNPRLFKSGQTSDKVYRALWATLLAGDTWRGELTNRTRDGRALVEAVTISPVRDENGQPRHFVAVKEDVTQARAAARAQREADTRLAQVERMRTLDALVGGMAHEFNNILVAILGYSDLGARILSSGKDPVRVSSYLDEIRKAGERARHLVAQLRAFGRSGEHATVRLDLAAMLADFASLLAVALPKNIVVETLVPAAIPELMIDRGGLQQVLMNLCLNARDAMPSGGTVQLRVDEPALPASARCDSCHAPLTDRYLRIEVSDDGAGIEPEALARLFEPFFTTKDPATGTGLGLAVVHGIVHRHGGHVQVDRARRRGAAISVLLPL